MIMNNSIIYNDEHGNVMIMMNCTWRRERKEVMELIYTVPSGVLPRYNPF